MRPLTGQKSLKKESFCAVACPVYDLPLMDEADDSISEWLGRLKSGEAVAAPKLWDRYSAKLIRLAKQRLGKTPPGISNEDDLALSVFGSIFRGAAEGRFEEITT